jgi:hypothetical protein
LRTSGGQHTESRLATDHPVLRVFGTGDLTRFHASFRADSSRGFGVC